MTVTASFGQVVLEYSGGELTVVKDGRDVFRRKLVRRVRDQETRPECQQGVLTLSNLTHFPTAPSPTTTHLIVCIVV